MIIVNAQDLGRTRLCEGSRCEHDAEPGQELCAACQQKLERTGSLQYAEHTNPVNQEGEIRCSECGQWLPETAFARANHKPWRYNRANECLTCRRHNRQTKRSTPTPTKRCAGFTLTPVRACRAYPIQGSAYCIEHQDQSRPEVDG